MKKGIRLSVFIFIISVTIFNAGCNLITEPGSTNPSDLIGTWQLYKQTGALQDVCPDEILRLSSDGTAKLQCPGQQEITRNYSASNGVLTYTQTGVSFDFFVVTNSSTVTLELYGKNISRNLFYNKTDSIPIINGKGSGELNINSSENLTPTL